MSCSSCSPGLQAYVQSTPRPIIATTGRVVGGSLGHFGAYVPSTARSTITGPVESVPNATGGMHVGPHSRLTDPGMSGLGEIFGPGQTNWIDGIANEYIVAAGALVILLVVMK